MLAIKTEKLTKKFADRTVVDSVDLSVENGELFSLLGVNGAGKTTTIRMLCGLSRPNSGNAWLLGKSISEELEKVKAIINISPQETAVAPNLSVRENLQLIAGIYGSSEKCAQEKVSETIRKFKLNNIEKQKAKTLSGGWQRRLSIAMALISDPKIIFLDEPTLGLDVIARRELWATIRELKGKITVILTTHYMEEAEALSDRVAIMANGRIKAIGTVKELKEQSQTNNFEDTFIKFATDTQEEK